MSRSLARPDPGPGPGPLARFLGRWGIWLLVLAVLLQGLVLAPAGVNGDGVGYLKQVSCRSLTPGHVAYLPLARAVALVWPHHTMLDLAVGLRWLSLLSAALALALFHDAARRLLGAGGALAAAALLACSHAMARSALEVETYAPAMLLLVMCQWSVVRCQASGLAGHGAGLSAASSPGPEPLAPGACAPGSRAPWPWAALAGVCAALASLMHLTLALLAVPLALELGRRTAGRRALLLPATALAAMTALLLCGLGLAAGEQGLSGLWDLWAWLRSSDHGIAYPHRWYAPLTALWGLCRSMVHAPYPHEAPTWKVALLTLPGAAIWLLLLGGLLRGREGPPAASGQFPGRSLAAWTLPLGLFALLFFPSDTERWLFVLPGLLLYLRPRPGRWLWGLLGAMVLLNLATYQLPLARDRSPLDRAAAADRLLAPEDLLVSPGHGWEELVGLGSRRPARLFPLIFHAGAMRSVERAVEALQGEARWTWSQGGRVLVARLRDRTDARGFKELGQLGFSEERFSELFSGHEVRATGVSQLWEVLP